MAAVTGVEGGAGGRGPGDAPPARGPRVEALAPGAGGSAPLRACAGEAARALAVMACMIGFTLLWARLEGWAGGAGGVYPSCVVASSAARPEASERGAGGELPRPPSTWLVDGFNVLKVGMLGSAQQESWWQAPARTRLVELAACFDDPRARLWIVFDGPRPAPPELSATSRRVRVRFEPSADGWLLARVRAARDPARLALVTADRKLASRARQRGAQVVAPRAFLERCAIRATAGRPAPSEP